MSRYSIRVGAYSIGCFDTRRVPSGTTVGRYCSFSYTARIIDANHPLDSLTTHPVAYLPQLTGHALLPVRPTRLVIEDDVWVGHGATILPGCARIGRGAVVGAGAVVTRDIPPYAVMAGSPARMIRSRFQPEVVAALEASEWWLMDMPTLGARLARHRDVLTHPTVESIRRFAADASA